ncbi:MAG: cytochrome b/b6 domain-containing protein [Acidobacteria bacterium]|nr:cytochrome b/b6 domain-containing protein [Acidobacteriota bacterium]
MCIRVILAMWCAALWAAAPSGPSQKPEESACASCHDQDQKLKKSAHASVGCATCHPKHEEYPHPAGVPKPVCGQCHAQMAGDYARSVHGLAVERGDAAPDCALCHGSAHELIRARSEEFRKAVPQTCAMCHAEVAQQFLASVHGKALERGIVQAPLCTDCHGEHSIQKHTNANSPVHASHIRETCAQCHANVRLSRKFGMPADRVVSFDGSFHGLAAKAGSQVVANCASCHGTHNILPSSDPKSTVNPKNLPKTCGNCHPGAGKRFALGPIHLWDGRVEPASVRWVRQIYQILIPLLIGLMLIHNGGNWVRKLVRLRVRRIPLDEAAPSRAIRMFPLERIQHALLATSFIVLAWSGFQLKYPDQWWARPMLMWEETWSVRGIVHRTASVAFMIAALMHVISLIVNPKLRQHWKKLWPRPQDIPEAIENFLYNVGLRSRPPRISPYSYIEKAEYWAVVWGGVVMGLTGLMLWANSFILKWLPKEWLDFATSLHFYEALLACLAIVVWHFYGVIFDPEVYPIDTAWLNGRTVRAHEHEAEAEEPAAKAEPQRNEVAK